MYAFRTYLCFSIILGLVLLSGSFFARPHEVSVRSSEEQATRKVIDSFNEVFNRHDADALAELLTDDTVFEDTSPAPDGKRIEGKASVVAFWRGWFARNPDAPFEAEEIIVSGLAVSQLAIHPAHNSPVAGRKSRSEAGVCERLIRV
jgi:ketosteroid isomerase-like protein